MTVASWIIRNKETKEVIAETFNAKAVGILNTDKYEAIPIEDYLIEFNQQIEEPARGAK